ncbi:MAG: tetratricopeptide repeat protein [bacterium]|nr:tetratricopeptide repeat protein [bacterium]
MTPRTFWLLLTLLTLAAGLRFYGLDWGTDGQTFHAFHPDEQTLIDSSARIGRDMRGIVSSYGKAPMYVLAGTARALGWVVGKTPFSEDTTRFTVLVARGISAGLGTLTVVLTFLLGRRIGDTTTGLVSAFFLTFCVGHIQQCHYFTVDIFLTFWVTLALVLVMFLPSSRVAPYLGTGVAVGIAAGTRLVGTGMVVPFLLAHLLAPSGVKALPATTGKFGLSLAPFRSRRVWQKMAITLAGVVVLFLICEPYLLLDPDLFFSDSDARRLIPSMQIASGERVHMWTLFDFSTTPYLFYLTHILRDALGYPLELSALVGILLILRQRTTPGLLLLGWLIPYFLLVGGLHTKPIRYATPMIPALCILGAMTSLYVGRWFRKRHTRAYLLPAVLLAIPTVMYALAFTRIYGTEDSRITASRWIAKNLPDQASILTERGGFPTQWMGEDGPFHTRVDQASFLLNTEGFVPYWEQIAYLDDLLKGVDWILSIDENRSRQFAGVQVQYPIGYRFYDKLKSGELGFVIQKEIQVQPSLFGLSFHHRDSDPTATAYDHPKVVLYKRVGNVSQAMATWRAEALKDPSLPDRALQEGIDAYRAQNWALAEQAFQETITLRPTFLLGHIMIVNTLLKSGKRQEADDLWIKLDSEFGGIPDEIGMGLSKAGLYREGILYLERSLALYAQTGGGSPQWIPKTLAESWYLLGQTLQDQKANTEAENAYKQVIRILPEFDLVYQNLGEIYLSENRPEDALPQFEKAVSLDLRNDQAWFLLGKAYLVKGDLENAKMNFQQAMGLAPQVLEYRQALEALGRH